MSRILVLAAFLALSCCFQIKTDTFGESPAEQTVAAIPWPFTTCGDGDWTIDSLSLDQAPKRNINDNIVTVRYDFMVDWDSQGLNHLQTRLDQCEVEWCVPG